MSRSRFLIDLPLSPRWEAIEVLRQTVSACFATLWSDVERGEALAMVVAELLENAVKYAHWVDRPARPADFRLRVSGDAERVMVRVRNAVSPQADLAPLFAVMKRLAEAPAQTVYLELLQQVAADPRRTGGLGLARIAHEGRCRLDARVCREGVVEVRATMGV